MAKPILPAGTTMVLRRDMKEFGIMFSRYGKSTPNLVGSLKRTMTKLSFAARYGAFFAGPDSKSTRQRIEPRRSRSSILRGCPPPGSPAGRPCETVAV